MGNVIKITACLWFTLAHCSAASIAIASSNALGKEFDRLTARAVEGTPGQSLAMEIPVPHALAQLVERPRPLRLRLQAELRAGRYHRREAVAAPPASFHTLTSEMWYAEPSPISLRSLFRLSANTQRLEPSCAMNSQRLPLPECLPTASPPPALPR